MNAPTQDTRAKLRLIGFLGQPNLDISGDFTFITFVVSIVVFNECNLEIVGFHLREMNSDSVLKSSCRMGVGLANITTHSNSL